MLPVLALLLVVSVATAIPHCPAKDRRNPVFFEHEVSCSRYYECANGRAYLMRCPSGLHFNKNLKTCDYPNHAGCIYINGDDNAEPFDGGDAPAAVA
ncbi:hypothetical protein NQ315_009572 [Exocentrus adspersus]|uniref:Chitin-binding type-2 domain-containing protein n=1 Tax=Exocentrus adspersus TaxID=1586481 RepID=A0AAV8WGR4_9CUCU|nr:hypothetical protein NQ315_009572 [Exocentrus adspersus]